MPDHEIAISSESGAHVKYETETTGKIVSGGDVWDDVDQKHAAGTVGPATDSYRFNGDIVSFDITQNEDDVVVELDGRETAPELLGMHRVELRAGEKRTHYEIASAGRIIRTANEPIDVVVGENIAKGTMKGGTDVYRCESGPTMIWASEDIEAVRNDGEPRTIPGTTRGGEP